MALAVHAHPRHETRLPSVIDVLGALAVTGLAISGSIGEAHPTMHATASQIQWIRTHQPGGAYALVVVAGLALVVRRKWPLAVLGVTVAAVAAYAAAGYVPGAALTAVFVALFTVGILEPRNVAIGAGVSSMAVLFVASGAGGPFGWLGGTNTVMLAFATAAVALGSAVAGRRQVFAAMVERAERAERDREEETRRRVDAERLRIARELHDVVAHSMSMINVQAGVAAHVLSTQPEQAEEALTAIKVASREGLRELRAILNVLRQVDDDAAGGVRAPAPNLAQLDALADATTQAGLPTTVTVSGRVGGLSPAVELAVYRIVQESLTNVLRHAGPSAHATVRVVAGKRKLLVAVHDDGGGVAAGQPGDQGFGDGTGTGIAGMRERVSAFGGKIKVGPGPGHPGWTVLAVLPLPGERRAGPTGPVANGTGVADPVAAGDSGAPA
ncbi:MAG TPA: sensor histidine kinase [Acidimicrobiales bacterium]